MILGIEYVITMITLIKFSNLILSLCLLYLSNFYAKNKDQISKITIKIFIFHRVTCFYIFRRIQSRWLIYMFLLKIN